MVMEGVRLKPFLPFFAIEITRKCTSLYVLSKNVSKSSILFFYQKVSKRCRFLTKEKSYLAWGVFPLSFCQNNQSFTFFLCYSNAKISKKNKTPCTFAQIDALWAVKKVAFCIFIHSEKTAYLCIFEIEERGMWNVRKRSRIWVVETFVFEWWGVGRCLSETGGLE